MKTGTIRVGDLDIFYREFGSGPPLVVFHGGWATGKMNWGPHYDWLGERFRVISPDHRGHGQTPNPAPGFESYRRLADEMAAFLDALQLPEAPTILGHSSGGHISLQLAMHYPHHVARQVLIGTHPNLGISETFLEGMRTFFHTDDFNRPPSRWRYIWNEPVNFLALWFAHRATGWYRLLQQAWAMWLKPLGLTSEDFAKVTCPTFLLNAEVDEFGSRDDFLELQEKIPHATHRFLPVRGHLFVIKEATATREAIEEWLDQQG